MMNQTSSSRVLLVVDVQRRVVANAWQRDAVVATIASLVDAARPTVPVVWVRHSSENMPMGSDDWQIVDELAPAPGEPIVEKQYGDAFEATDLEAVLTKLGAHEVIVCGAQTDACVISTLYGGFVRGYDVTLISDAHTTDDWSAYGMPTPNLVIETVNSIWHFRTAPGRVAKVMDAQAAREYFAA